MLYFYNNQFISLTQIVVRRINLDIEERYYNATEITQRIGTPKARHLVFIRIVFSLHTVSPKK